MLEHMPDVVRFQYCPMDGDYRLYGIGTKDMFMPSWVVKAQGKMGGGGGGGGTLKNMEGSEKEEECYRGLQNVCNSEAELWWRTMGSSIYSSFQVGCPKIAPTIRACAPFW